MRGKPNRVVSLRHRRPHIKGRAWGLDAPPEAVQRVGDQLVPARVYPARRASLVLAAVHRLDRGPLHRLEDSRVDVRLELTDEVDQVGAAAHPADPPAGHVVRLRERVELEADLLRAGYLKERERLVPVEGDLRVRRVVAEDDVVPAAEVDGALEEFAIRRRRGW